VHVFAAASSFKASLDVLSVILLLAAVIMAVAMRACLRMQGWKCGVLALSDGEMGGYKEVTLEVKGDSVYSKLKYEAGAAPACCTLARSVSQCPKLVA
jgi:PCRF domain